MPSEKTMAPHSSTLAWKIQWTEEPDRLQSKGSLRVGDDWATSLSLFTFMHWRRKWQPTPVFLPGEPQGWGAWWASVYGVAPIWTQLKRLSSSSSNACLKSDFSLVHKSCPLSTTIILNFCAPHRTLTIQLLNPLSLLKTKRNASHYTGIFCHLPISPGRLLSSFPESFHLSCYNWRSTYYPVYSSPIP